ncbi:Neural-cadherin [Amphibalanus amphitrite]|uniref:Neural-cadherin n=1 Tax=Amphibalanus amphitrite TaxID=1232801 RepID=A0A6A4VMW2_AMPAM|nr:Neural-cadherin [Amphibalanus amphitrite]
MFSINRQTGVIRLVGPASPLTQHSEENFTFTVVARDTHNLNDTATVHVHVIDVNNNRPVFPLCAQYRPEVEENKGVGTAVLRLEATDEDKGQNAELVYSLVNSPSSPESFFAIDPVSGQLTTVKVSPLLPHSYVKRACKNSCHYHMPSFICRQFVWRIQKLYLRTF